jgi:hypothetical protein
MNALDRNSLVARLVAWHNRHPLARRISADQVTEVGLVALPMRASPAPGVVPAEARDTEPLPGASPRARVSAPPESEAGSPAKPPGLIARLAARLRRPDAPVLQAAFSEDFMAPLPLSAVHRFARRHGIAQVAEASGWPRREVPADPALMQADTGMQAQMLHLVVATINATGQRRSVLLGGGETPAVLGRRAWSTPRSAAAASAALALSAAAAAVAWLPGGPDAPAMTQIAAPPRPEAAASATAAAQEQAAPVLDAASAAVADAPALAGSAALAGPPGRLREGLPAISIRPNLRDAVGEATLRKAGGARIGSEGAGQPAPPPPVTVFALAGKPARARAAAELRLALLEDAVSGMNRSDDQHTEVLRVDATWRAVWWPFASREAAERARAELAARGVQLELVAF